MLKASQRLRLKKSLLIIIFSAIVITAHPTPATYPLIDILWPPLHIAGVDVFMKPFTSDMVFMYDPELKTSLYTDNFEIVYDKTTGPHTIDVRDLSFHRFRVPFTWLGIAARDGTDTTPYIETLCNELQRSQGKGTGFTIQSTAHPDVAQKYHMNQKIGCPTNG